MLVHLMLSQTSVRLASFLFILFSIFCSVAVIPTFLSSRSFICSSASVILLLTLSSVLFTSVYSLVFLKKVIIAQSCPSLCTPLTIASRTPLFRGFSRQEYSSGLPFPPARDLPDPGIKSISPALMDGGGLPTWWLFSLRRPSSGVYGLYGRVNSNLQEGFCQGGPSWTPVASAPFLWRAPTDPHLHGGPPAPAGGFGSVSCGVTPPFLWVLLPSKTGISVSPSPVEVL